MLNQFGKMVIQNVRDRALKISMDIVKQKTSNPIKIKQYEAISNLTNDQQEAICDLLSETVTDVIYRFLEMFEENSKDVQLLISNKEGSYDLTEISEKMGSEIACYNDEGWIQKFSKIGRFVL